jgi:hypothetical protein
MSILGLGKMRRRIPDKLAAETPPTVEPEDDPQRWLLELSPGPGRILHFPCLWDLPDAPVYGVWLDGGFNVIGGSSLSRVSVSRESLSTRTTKLEFLANAVLEVRYIYIFSKEGRWSFTKQVHFLTDQFTIIKLDIEGFDGLC